MPGSEGQRCSREKRRILGHAQNNASSRDDSLLPSRCPRPGQGTGQCQGGDTSLPTPALLSAEPSAPVRSFPVQQPSTSLLSPITLPSPLNFWWLQHPRWLPKQLPVPGIQLEHPSPSVQAGLYLIPTQRAAIAQLQDASSPCSTASPVLVGCLQLGRDPHGTG